MGRPAQLAPEDQFPRPAIAQSVQVQPKPAEGAGGTFILQLAASADSIIDWGRNTVARDRELRKYWPTESVLAGALVNVCFRNATFDWEIKGPSEKVINATTDMLNTAIAGDKVGWVEFTHRFSQDLYSQDNGGFIEPIREPGMDGNSKFKGAMAPVIGIAHLDAGACTRTGNAATPVLYKDIEGEVHKLQYYEVIPFADFPSPIQTMNGVGVCSVSRALRMSQIMRSVFIFKDEQVSGRNVKQINIVGGVGRQQLDDAVKRTVEQANNKGNLRYIEHALLASIDPEKPVSVATVDLASLPEGYNYDQDMQWFIAILALDFGVDYQEFAPLAGGPIGSSAQSTTLNRKASGKGPRNWMEAVSRSFKNYGVLPRGYSLEFADIRVQDNIEKQEARTGAAEEAAIIVNSKIFSPEAVAKSLIKRGIYEQVDFDNSGPEWYKASMDAAENEANPPKQMVGARGGNTTREDAGRTESGKPKPRVGDRLRKFLGRE